jgi:arrestin-2
VSYAVQFYVGVDDEEPRSSECFIEMSIVKLQHAPITSDNRLPMAWISKGLAFSQGKIDLEVTLDREYFFHGDQVPVSVIIINDSSRTINYVKSYVTQHTEVILKHIFCSE